MVFDLLTSSMQRKSRVRISLHSRINTLPSLITRDVDPLRFHTKISELFAKLAFWKLRGLASRHKFFSTGNLESNRGIEGDAALLNPASGFEPLQFERHADSNNSSRRLLHQVYGG